MLYASRFLRNRERAVYVRDHECTATNVIQRQITKEEYKEIYGNEPGKPVYEYHFNFRYGCGVLLDAELAVFLRRKYESIYVFDVFTGQDGELPDELNDMTYQELLRELKRANQIGMGLGLERRSFQGNQLVVRNQIRILRREIEEARRARAILESAQKINDPTEAELSSEPGEQPDDDAAPKPDEVVPPEPDEGDSPPPADAVPPERDEAPSQSETSESQEEEE